MAKKKKEEPVADNETGKIKVKKKSTMKKVTGEETVTKVDLNKPPKPKENEEPKETTENTTNDPGVVTELKDANTTQEQKEVQPKEEAQETPIVEEVTKTEEVANKVEQAIEVAEKTGTELPEGIQKVVNFINETGGDLNDYVKLNQDYSDMDNQTVLEEYYKQTKPHLTGEEISFLMEDNFSYDEDEHTEKEIKRKKLALKEQVADARTHLEERKSRYYDEIKGGSKLTDEQREAINFYNEQKGVAESNEAITNDFIKKTNRFFGDQFKGFEYNVGDKRFRYNVQDVSKVKQSQEDINKFIGKFLDDKGMMSNESEYHKSLFTAMNPDAIAKHFYEQGQADAIKNSVADSKNINMKPRQELTDGVQGGVKIRALDDDTNTFKFKIKK